MSKPTSKPPKSSPPPSGKGKAKPGKSRPSATPKPPDTRPVKLIPKNYPAAVKIDESYVKYRFERKTDPHPHPVAHIEREIGENIIYEMIQYNYPNNVGAIRIHDIGGNPKRHLGRPNVWCSCPILDPQDEVRHTARLQQLNASWCTHKVQDCDCINTDIYMSVHSLYYLTPDDVSECVYGSNLREMYALIHQFPDPMGQLMHGEAQYTYTAPDQVKMTVNGSSFTYRHSALNWLGNGYFMPPCGRPIAWELMKQLPNSIIIKLVPSQVYAEPPEPLHTFESAFANPNAVGEVQFTMDSNISACFRLISAELPSLPCYSIKRWIAWFMGDQPHVLVDKQLLANLTRYIAGRPRTEDMFSMLIAEATSKIKLHNIPPEIMANTAFATAVVAFHQNVDYERGLLDLLHQHNNKFVEYTQRLHSFSAHNPWLIRGAKMLGLLTVPLIAYCVFKMKIHPASLFPIQISVTSSLVRAACIAIGVPFAEEGLRHYLTRRHPLAALAYTATQMMIECGHMAMAQTPPLVMIMHAYKFVMWQILHFAGNKMSLLAYSTHALNNIAAYYCGTIVPVVIPPANLFTSLIGKIFAVCASVYTWFMPSKKDPNAAVRNVIQSMRDYKATHEIHFDKNQPASLGFTPVYPGLKCDVPIAEQQEGTTIDIVGDDYTHLKGDRLVITAHGVTNVTNLPACVATTQHNEFLAVANRVTRAVVEPDPFITKIFFEWLRHNFDVLFPDWRPIESPSFDNWNRRFPQHLQKLQVMAKRRTETLDLNWKKLTKRKAFIKREVIMPNHLGHFKPVNPRLIQSVSHEANVVLGPWMYAFSNQLAKMWNPRHFLCSAPGNSADTLGHAIYQFHDKATIILDDDHEKFDAHYMEFDYEVEKYIYEKFGLNGDALKIFMAQFYTVGYTYHSVRFTADYKRKSGDPNTSCGNTTSNGLKHKFVDDCFRWSKKYLYSYYLNEKKYTIGDWKHMIREGFDKYPDTNQDFKGIYCSDDGITLADWDINFSELPSGTPKDLSLWHQTLQECVTDLFVLLGLTTVANINAADKPYRSVFCSARLYPVSKKYNGVTESYSFGPKIGRVISKFGATIKKVPDPQVFLKGIALGLMPDAAHVPILYEFLKQVLDVLQGVKAEPVFPERRFHSSGTWKPSRDVKTMLSHAYGITPADITSLINYLKGIKRFPVALSHPILTKITGVDMDFETPN